MKIGMEGTKTGNDEEGERIFAAEAGEINETIYYNGNELCSLQHPCGESG